MAVLGFMTVRPDRRLMQPIRDAENKLDIAQQEFDRAEADHMKLLVARDQIERARAAGLPHKTTDAQRLYQTWITNLGDQCGFAAMQVVPGRTEVRRDQYLTVNVDVTAETDLKGLSRFLFLFENADLTHRISGLEIRSSGAQGNPRMEVSFTAEGMSVAGSPDRSDIFPRSSVSEPASAETTEVVIADAADFDRPTPYPAQLGREMVRVVSVDKTNNRLVLERGQQGTTAVAHNPGDIVQMFPIAVTRRDADFDAYQEFLAASPFTKPAPARVFRPRIASITDKTVAPGEAVAMTAKGEDFNPDVGPVGFALTDAAEGMAIDAGSGEFSWKTTSETPPGKYTATVVMTQQNDDAVRIEKPLTITVKLPNDPPKLEVPEDAIVVIGREFSLKTKATDDGPADALKFTLEGENLPTGLAIDEKQGTLSWTPERTLHPGDYNVTVKVTDGGDPSLSATAPLKLTLKDDTAILTKFTGAVTRDGHAAAWFWNQGENTKPELKVGDHIIAAEIDAELVEIDRRHVLMKDPLGVWKLSLGNNLRQRELITPAEPVEPEASPNAEADASAESAASAETSAPAADIPPAESDPQQKSDSVPQEADSENDRSAKTGTTTEDTQPNDNESATEGNPQIPQDASAE